MEAALKNYTTLVLNADFRPLSYYPLSVWPWQLSVKAALSGRVNTIVEYDRVVRSPNMEMALPSVVSLKEYVKLVNRPAFTRFNVFLRDKFTCQYSGQRMPSHELTFDHVIPKSRGGLTTWENVVTASSEFNLRKGNLTLEQAGLSLLNLPCCPSAWQLMENGRSFPPNYLHTSWQEYLYWDTELEQ